MERVCFSRPVALALRQDVISTSTTVLDYGCGRGGDVRRLRAIGVAAAGWDPFFAPHVPLQAADVVTLTYVINVIEDSAERIEVLRRAFELARTVLIVTVRVEPGLGDVPARRNGSWTGGGTFQKFYTQTEFLGLLATTLGAHPRSPATGIAYLFRLPQAEERYMALTAERGGPTSKAELLDTVLHDGGEWQFEALAEELGRLPRVDEWLEKIRARPCRCAGSGPAGQPAPPFAQRARDIVAFLATLRKHRVAPPNFRSLSATMKKDVLAIWGSYYTALREANAVADTAASTGALPPAIDTWAASRSVSKTPRTEAQRALYARDRAGAPHLEHRSEDKGGLHPRARIRAS